MDKNTTPCKRCAGEGRLWNHANVLGGVCFACRGTGVKHKTVKVDVFYVMNRVLVNGQPVGGYHLLWKGTCPQGEQHARDVIGKRHGFDPAALVVTVKKEERRVQAA